MSGERIAMMHNHQYFVDVNKKVERRLTSAKKKDLKNPDKLENE